MGGSIRQLHFVGCLQAASKFHSSLSRTLGGYYASDIRPSPAIQRFGVRTTSSIAAKYLGKPLKASLNFEQSDVPPIAEIEGVDLVTEGVITINKVIEYAKDALGKNELYEEWGFKRDGASLICRMLFEEATDINFYVGRAVNPAHQNPDLPINFNIKMNLVKDLCACLKEMGKRVKVSYF